MGEVRIQVLLTNIVDRTNANHGMVARDQIRTYTANAMVDTGAVCTIVPQHVVDILGLDVEGHRVAECADGRKDVVNLVGPILLEIDGRTTMDEASVLGDEVLIGQTVLEKMDLHVDCANRRFVANPAHPDQPVLKVK